MHKIERFGQDGIANALGQRLVLALVAVGVTFVIALLMFKLQQSIVRSIGSGASSIEIAVGAGSVGGSSAVAGH